MESATTGESVMDLSLRNFSSSLLSSSPKPDTGPGIIPIVRPVPRPPWSILWYQNLWSLNRDSNPLSSTGEENNDENNAASTSNCGYASSSQTEDHRLYRFSMAAALSSSSANTNSSDGNYYPLTCRHYEYRRPSSSFLHQQQHPPLPKLAEARTTGCEKKMATAAAQGSMENSFGAMKKDADCDDDSYSENSESVVVTITERESRNFYNKFQETSIRSMQELGQHVTASLHHHQQQHNDPNSFQQTASTIMDIACCDGPVQFTRISNPNFALTVEHNEDPRPQEDKSSSAVASTMEMIIGNKKTDTNHLSSSSSSSTLLLSTAVHAGKKCNNNNSSRQQQTCFSSVLKSGSFEEKATDSLAVDENNTTTTASSNGSSTTTAPLLKAYLCIYCNQSFKSLFCYQKHKKRHLNPVSVDITTTVSTATSSTSQRDGNRTGNMNKRAGSIGCSGGGGGGGLGGGGSSGTTSGGNASSSCSKNNTGGSRNSGGLLIGNFPENTKAKTKDLNVQFFPCKKCGCKFPSYYFVHKHRKICH